MDVYESFFGIRFFARALNLDPAPAASAPDGRFPKELTGNPKRKMDALLLLPDRAGSGSERKKETGDCDRNKLTDVREQRVGECGFLTDAKQC